MTIRQHRVFLACAYWSLSVAFCMTTAVLLPGHPRWLWAPVNGVLGIGWALLVLPLRIRREASVSVEIYFRIRARRYGFDGWPADTSLGPKLDQAWSELRPNEKYIVARRLGRAS